MIEDMQENAVFAFSYSVGCLKWMKNALEFKCSQILMAKNAVLKMKVCKNRIKEKKHRWKWFKMKSQRKLKQLTIFYVI